MQLNRSVATLLNRANQRTDCPRIDFVGFSFAPFRPGPRLGRRICWSCRLGLRHPNTSAFGWVTLTIAGIGRSEPRQSFLFGDGFFIRGAPMVCGCSEVERNRKKARRRSDSLPGYWRPIKSKGDREVRKRCAESELQREQFPDDTASSES